MFAKLSECVCEPLDRVRNMVDAEQANQMFSPKLAVYYKTIGMQEFAVLHCIDAVINGMTIAIYNRTKLIVDGYERV
jgi:hypothetical protein